MKPFVAIAVCVAVAGCHSTQKPPPPIPAVNLPQGADLKPWASGANDMPLPYSTALLGGKVWMALSNFDSTYSPAGPGLLVSLEPQSGAIGIVDLGGQDERQCQAPSSNTALKADGGKLYVSCAGGTGGQALVEVDPVAGKPLRYAHVPSGFSPGAIAIAGSKIWVGDGFSDRIVPIDRASFSAGTPVSVGCPGQYPFVPAMMVAGGDLYALCFQATDGYMARLDAATGEPKGDKVLVGGGPLALTLTGDGRIAVINSLSGTLTLVTPSASSLKVDRDILNFPSSNDLEDVKALNQFLYVVSSNTQTLVKVDLSVSAPKIVDEAALNASSLTNVNFTRVEVIDDDDAVVIDSGQATLARAVGVQFGQKKGP